MELLLAFIRDTVLSHPWHCAICLDDDDGHPVGVASMSPMEDVCRAELGYVLACTSWGKGVAMAAMKRMVA